MFLYLLNTLSPETVRYPRNFFLKNFSVLPFICLYKLFLVISHYFSVGNPAEGKPTETRKQPMEKNSKPSKLLAEKLLNISAIQLQPESPFIWASGWNSPIYTDLRKALSYVDVRNYIKIELARTILEHFPDADAVASVAKGAVAFAAVTADALGLPYAFVRNAPKDHGLENMIEGNLKPGWKVVVIEDLVSTGGSCINSVDAIRNVGCEVTGIVSVFDFEFPIAKQRFNKENISLESLLTYTTMLEVAKEIQYLNPSDVIALKEWREDPASWTPTVRD